MIRRRKPVSERRGAAALEFALVAGLFLPLCLGILDAGLLFWTKGALQSTAALAARCVAIASASCPDPGAFAVTIAGNWIFPGIISKPDVTKTTVCTSTVSYTKITITTKFWAGGLLPPPFNNRSLTVTAYHPAGTC